jgi:hypothetical protein
MTVKYVKDFEFPRSFGFGGSATKGAADEPMIPASTAANAARGAAALGARVGRRQLAQGALQHLQRARAAQPAEPAPAPAAAPGMAQGGDFIQKAVKHPGRMKRLAAQHGKSLGDEIAHDKHSTDPSLRAAANLGARFRSGDLHKKGK